jgi:hypothetical protein
LPPIPPVRAWAGCSSSAPSRESELYRALDWLGARQAAIETALARRHLKDGALVLYDVSSR